MFLKLIDELQNNFINIMIMTSLIIIISIMHLYYILSRELKKIKKILNETNETNEILEKNKLLEKKYDRKFNDFIERTDNILRIFKEDYKAELNELCDISNSLLDSTVINLNGQINKQRILIEENKIKNDTNKITILEQNKKIKNLNTNFEMKLNILQTKHNTIEKIIDNFPIQAYSNYTGGRNFEIPAKLISDNEVYLKIIINENYNSTQNYTNLILNCGYLKTLISMNKNINVICPFKFVSYDEAKIWFGRFNLNNNQITIPDLIYVYLSNTNINNTNNHIMSQDSHNLTVISLYALHLLYGVRIFTEKYNSYPPEIFEITDLYKTVYEKTLNYARNSGNIRTDLLKIVEVEEIRKIFE